MPPNREQAIAALPELFKFNAQTERYENLVQAGVIDPAKAVRSGMQNAASIASLLLTTEAVISQIPGHQNRGASPRPSRFAAVRPIPVTLSQGIWR